MCHPFESIFDFGSAPNARVLRQKVEVRGEVVVMPFHEASMIIFCSSSRGCEKSLKQVALKEFRSCVSLVYLSEVNLAGVQP
ncbi:hypothetical protein RRG08_020061 [Elysia crispata]|uniref:Uncharacterized protein n=1 Tax=Elysia crispata TaxID=231223 RepID=A0AAE0YI82_9GAST|nr:hypothetical protein RRG08_020061 [Elysia crispata]